MTSRVLDKADWHQYFETLANAVHGKQTHIEVIGTQIGDQTLARSVPLLGITYEPAEDLLQIALKGFDHLVQHPRKITVEEDGGNLLSFEVIDGDGQQQIITLHPAIRL